MSARAGTVSQGPSPARPECVRQGRQVIVAQRERRGAGGRARGLRPSSPRDCHDARCQADEPGERDLLRCRAEPIRDRDAAPIGEPAGPPGAGRRAASARSAPTPPRRTARRRLPGSPGRRGGSATTSAAAIGASSSASSSCRRLTFETPTPRTRPSSTRRARRADRRPPGRPRIGCVDQVEVDREAVERREARLAVGADRLRATVGRPGAADPPHAALRHDPRASLRADPTERAGEQPLVVAELPFAVTVGAGGVEDRDTGPGCRGDRRERALLVAVGPSRGACSRGRCGAQTGQAIQEVSGCGGYSCCGTGQRRTV